MFFLRSGVAPQIFCQRYVFAVVTKQSFISFGGLQKAYRSRRKHHLFFAFFVRNSFSRLRRQLPRRGSLDKSRSLTRIPEQFLIHSCRSTNGEIRTRFVSLPPEGGAGACLRRKELFSVLCHTISLFTSLHMKNPSVPSGISGVRVSIPFGAKVPSGRVNGSALKSGFPSRNAPTTSSFSRGSTVQVE